MPTLSWGSFLSLVLPGMVALIGLRHASPVVAGILGSAGTLSVGSGFFLLAAACIAGGLTDGARRVLVDELLFRRKGRFWRHIAPPSRSYAYYLDDRSLPVFQAGVEDSWRYYTFYANLGIASIGVVIAEVLVAGGFVVWSGGLAAAALVLAIAAKIQYAYFREFLKQFQERHTLHIRDGDSLEDVGTPLALGGGTKMKNWPDPGTPVTLLTAVRAGERTFKPGSRGVLVAASGKHGDPELITDVFTIRVGSDVINVRRTDIG